jgi:hypothetical protein
VHRRNTTRLTCANFTLVEGGGGNGTVTAIGTATGMGTGTTPSPSAFMGAAGKERVRGLPVGLVAVACALLL